MARMSEVGGDRRGGNRDSETARRRRVIAIGCVLVLFVLAVGLWIANSSSGVELTRSAANVEEPTDPEGTEVEGPESPEGGEMGDGDGAVEASKPDSTPAPTVVKVHVDGAVLAPGVYELHGDDPRVADAVAAAGGLLEEADTAAVNLAAQVRDADKVHIPRVEESATAVPGVGEIPAGSSTVEATPGPSVTASVGDDAGAASDPIDINTASAEELTALPGIGEKTAEKIVADREAQGPFSSPEDLMRVSGIGEKKFSQIRDLIRV